MKGTKSIEISKHLVWEAYKKVKANGGSPGIDQVTIELFDKNLKDNLYKLWNRMSSGSYFPTVVKLVEISKGGGKGMRPLGIPIVSDRIAQMVVVMLLESKVDSSFHPDSYGYRPTKSAHGAIDQARKRCWKYDWVLDIDIKGFFDNIDHTLLNKALLRHTEDNWIIMYVNRWLKVPYQTKEGELIPRHKGVPQGSVIGPLLSNLFLHYAFDEWMRRTHSDIPFERYADDSICHCHSKSEAEALKQSIQKRFTTCGLELNEAKTHIVYCKDSNRKEKHEVIAFDFLGYTFRPRCVKSKQGGYFTGFNPAISNKAKKRIGDKMREWYPRKWISLNLEEIAKQINPIIQGWINYYGKYYPSMLKQLLKGVNTHLAHWVRRKFKRFRHKITQSFYWLGHVARYNSSLFAHWRWGVKPTAG
jgi:RNA-directed DNA polymerase